MSKIKLTIKERIIEAGIYIFVSLSVIGMVWCLWTSVQWLTS